MALRARLSRYRDFAKFVAKYSRADFVTHAGTGSVAAVQGDAAEALSQIGVQEGQLVEKYGVLGRSGDTGLAGGDHLHFAILVGGVYVDPTEWWDAKWVEEKVMSRLGGVPAVAAGAETP